MAKILSLADGTVTLLPRGLPSKASNEVTLATSVFGGRRARPVMHRVALSDLAPETRARVEELLSLSAGDLAKAGFEGQRMANGQIFHNGTWLSPQDSSALVDSQAAAAAAQTAADAQAAWAAAHPQAPAAPAPAAPIPVNVPTNSPTAPTASVAIAPAAPAAPATAVALPPSTFPKVIKSWTDSGHNYETRQLSAEYGIALGDSLERLASMTLARKLRSPAPIGMVEAEEMVSLACVPDTAAGRMLTDRILYASAEELGKGGIIGSISHAVSHVVKTADSVMRAAAPLVAHIPVIGPVVSTGMSAVANAQDMLAGGNLKGIGAAVMHPMQTLTSIAGGSLGTAAALVGSAAQGIIQAPGAISSDLSAMGTWAASGVSSLASDIGGYLSGGTGGGTGIMQSILSGGKSLISSFDSSVASAIESVNPSLSGELTSIFHGLGSEYTNFASTFDSWSSSLKNSPLGTSVVGKVGNNLYTMIKDQTGKMNVTQTPIQNAPAALQSLQPGQLASTQTLAGLGVAQPAAGAGYGPGFSGSASGIPVNPAGISLPGGPVDYTADATSQAIMAQQVAKLAGQSQAPQLASMPLWAVAGLAMAGIAFVMKGGVMMKPGHRPRYVSSRRRR